MKPTAPAIVQEGLVQREKAGVKGWICTSCHHVMSFLSLNGGCANCENNNIQPIKSQERLHEETEAVKDTQRFHYWQKESFDATKWESQLGQALTSDQVLKLLKKFIPGIKMFPQFNKFLGKTLMAYYVPWKWNGEDVSATEKKGSLKFICCGEQGIMPEWDVHPLTDDGMPLPQIRGWRSIMGIFYRSGLIPFVPDDGRRLGWWQIKESPFKEKMNV